MASDAPARPKRILVVDDEHVIADTLKIIFGKAGYEAEVAYNGREAVECARTFRPDLVLSDIVMPVMDGIEAASLITDEVGAPTILLISGHAEGPEVLARVTHRFEVVSKPIHPDVLLRKVERLTAKAVPARVGT